MAPAAFIVLVAVVIAVRIGPLFRAPLLEEGDSAVNALQIDDAKHLHEIYGNYSRYEFHHPGPAFFYVYAAAEALLFDALHVVPSPGNAHLIAIICLQSAFLTAALWLLVTRLSWRPLAPLGLLGATLWLRWCPELMVSVWPPHVIAIPFLCFLVACTCVAAGDIGVLPVVVVAGGFLFHGHVAQSLFVVTIGATAIALGLRVRPTTEAEPNNALWATYRGTFLWSGMIALFFALPLLVDVIALGSRSNLAAIFGRFSANLEQRASFRQSILFFVTFPIASREQDAMLTANAGPAMGYFARQHWIAIAASVAILFAPSALRVVGRRRMSADERRFATSAQVLLAVAVLDCLVWGMAQTGAVRHYNGVSYYAVYFYAALFGLAIAARALAHRWREGADIGIAGLSAMILAFGLHGHPASAAERGLPIQRAVDAALAETHNQAPKLLVVARSNWPIAAAVAVELQRRGVDFVVSDWWSFMFQRQHRLPRVATPMQSAETWWIAPSGDGEVNLTSGLALYRQPAPLDPDGARIDFTTGGNAFRYVVTGIQDGDFMTPTAAGNMTTNERHVRFRFVAQRASHDVKITFVAASALDDHALMPARVRLNGEEVGRVAVQNRTEVAVRLTRKQWNRLADATLELYFPDARPLRVSARPDYTGWIGWRLWSIRFEPSVTPGESAGRVTPPDLAGGRAQ
ncbi:MAG TPA: hypothetical protein VHE61_01915 [Opitutaceae bacterium]|nr:hypothetical protein [Opitutaceae bacterium]